MGISEAGAPLNSTAPIKSASSTGQRSSHQAGATPSTSGSSPLPGRHGHEWPHEAAAPMPTVRYRGFVLIPQADLTWLIRPERSPMRILPFRAPASSLTDVKALVDWRLAQNETT